MGKGRGRDGFRRLLRRRGLLAGVGQGFRLAYVQKLAQNLLSPRLDLAQGTVVVETGGRGDRSLRHRDFVGSEDTVAAVAAVTVAGSHVVAHARGRSVVRLQLVHAIGMGEVVLVDERRAGAAAGVHLVRHAVLGP